jgi:thiol-disulfide isomerase/thioredoxin
MANIWFIGLIAFGIVTLINLLLTLRIIHWLRSIEEAEKRDTARETTAELSIGLPAPDFKAKTLAGDWVRLTTYASKAVVFIFVSTHCGSCRQKIPLLIKLSSLAKERKGIDFVLVSDSSLAETHAWVQTIFEEDEIEVTIPILVAPYSSTEFLLIYNPRRLTPYYCFIDEQAVVRARDPLGMGQWSKLQQEWEGSPTSKSYSGLFSRYQ